jgi:hypothetical protein
MPSLKKIIVQDFRNIGFQDLSFSPNVNCISGNNGEGKTNLLDAIYYLSMTKSAFSAPDRYNFRYGTTGFTLVGVYEMENGLESRFSLKATQEGKKLVRDDKPISRMAEHIGVLPVVMVSPGDGVLVSESGEERRRLSNAILSQMDPQYLSAVQQYNRLLAQRNKLLKEFSPDFGLMDVIDRKMSARRHISQMPESAWPRISALLWPNITALFPGAGKTFRWSTARTLRRHPWRTFSPCTVSETMPSGTLRPGSNATTSFSPWTPIPSGGAVPRDSRSLSWWPSSSPSMRS